MHQATCSGRGAPAAPRPAGLARQHVAPCGRAQRWGCRPARRVQRCRVAQPSPTLRAAPDYGEAEDDDWEPELPEAGLEDSLEDGLEDGAGEEGSEEGRALAVALARAASDTKAMDVLVLHVAPLVYWTSYLARPWLRVLGTVTSRPQLQAILGKMERLARDEWGRAPSAAAPGRSVWEVLDYGDVVVHLFTAEQREYYDLESFYGAAEEVELPFAGEQSEPVWTRQF